MKSGIVTVAAIVTGWVVALWVHHFSGAWFDPHTDPLALLVWFFTTLALMYIAL